MSSAYTAVDGSIERTCSKLVENATVKFNVAIVIVFIINILLV
jgi:hypothetical protein